MKKSELERKRKRTKQGRNNSSKKSQKTSQRKPPQTLSTNRQKQRLRKSGSKSGKKTLKELIITLGVTVMLFFILFIAACSLPSANGYSMTPTINDQDRLIVYKWGKIKRFSLVYFRNPEKSDWLIRRVIGRPGETFEYRSGILYINGAEIPERFLPSIFEEGANTPVTADFQLEEGKIPEGKYFLMGDNRAYATDSRYFGLVDEKEIQGTVIARIFPIHSLGQF